MNPVQVMALPGLLHEAIAAVAPIAGISIGDPDDRETWRIDFAAEATRYQKTKARRVPKTFELPV